MTSLSGVDDAGHACLQQGCDFLVRSHQLDRREGIILDGMREIDAPVEGVGLQMLRGRWREGAQHRDRDGACFHQLRSIQDVKQRDDAHLEVGART